METNRESKPVTATRTVSVFSRKGNNMTDGIKKISVSSIRDFCTCKFKYYGIYELKALRQTNSTMFFGTCVDFAVSKDYENKKGTDKNLPVSDVQEIFAAKFDAEKETVDVWEPGDDKVGTKDYGVEAVKVFSEEISKKIIPLEVQPYLRMTFEGSALEFNGKPDVVEVTGQIRDTKTTKKSWSQDALKRQIQPVGYSFLLDKMEEKDRECWMDILVRTKVPKVQQMKVDVNPAAKKYFLQYLSSIVHAVNSCYAANSFPPEAFYRNDPMCSEKYCVVAPLCRQTWGLDIPARAE
jgi:hypothetical protein